MAEGQPRTGERDPPCQQRPARAFGISADDFDALLEAQGGCCAICRSRPERVAALHLDHCHDTAAIRGILCGRCNQGLGLFGDDPALLDAASRYLRHGVTGEWSPTR